MTKQPHLDHRAIHKFYGTKQHYITLLTLGFLLIWAFSGLIAELYHLQQSRLTQAQIQHSVGYSHSVGADSAAPILLFNDPEHGEIRYWVYEDNLKKQIEHVANYWESIPVRYLIDSTGDVLALEFYSLTGTLALSLFYGFLILSGIFLLYRLSPRPYWYWKYSEAHFKRLSKHCICMEVRVSALNEVTLKHRSANRVCYLTGSAYFYQQNQLVQVKSPRILVEPQFRMSYPVMKVYFNPLKLEEYEVDLLEFLRLNGSSMHGFQEIAATKDKPIASSF